MKPKRRAHFAASSALLVTALTSHSVTAATLYWKTDTAAAWDSSSWATSPGGPYTSAWDENSDVLFEANGGTALSIAGPASNPLNFKSITANEDVAIVNPTPFITLGTNGTVASVTVAAGKTLNFGALDIALDGGTGFIKNGAGTWALSNADGYPGGFTLNAGTVNIASTSALGDGGALALNGGSLISTAATGRNLTGKFPGGITIGGDIAFGGGASTDALAFDANVNLGSASRTITVNSSSFTRFTGAGVISGAPGVGITKAGSGTLILDGSSVHTFSGPILANAGSLTIGGSASQTFAGGIVLNGGSLTIGGSAPQSFAGGVIVNGGTLTINDAGTHTFAGGITVNSGFLTIATTTTASFMNQVKMNGGTSLTYSFSKMATPTDLITNGSALTLEKFIQVIFTGNFSANSSQTLGALTINGGRQAMQVSSTQGGNMIVTLGNTWTRNDNAVLHFSYSGTALSALVASNPSELTNGIIGPWVTVASGGTYYATVSGGNVVPLTSTTGGANYAAAPAAASLSDTSGTINYDLSAVGTSPNDTVPTGAVANTLRYAGAAATMKQAGSLSLNGLLNVGSGALTVGAASNTLTIGSGRELVVNNNANGNSTTNKGITIASAIADNGAGASGVTLVGTSSSSPSTTILSNSANSFTGPATIIGTNALGDSVQTIQTTAPLPAAGVNSFLGAGSQIVLNGGIIQLTPAAAAATNRNFVLNCNSGLYLKGGNSLTVSGVFSGSGNLSVDCDSSSAGRLVLSGSNTFSGDVLLQTDGRLTLANANALANATLVVSGNRVGVDLNTNNLAYNIGGLRGNLSLNLGTGGAGQMVTIGSNNQSNTYAGILSGGSGLTKTGTGTQTLLAANTNGSATGATVVANGTLKLGSVAASVMNGTGTSGAVAITALTSTAGLAAGQAVSGTGIAVGAVIVSIDSATQVTVSAAHTAPFSASAVTFGATAGAIVTPAIEVKAGATLDVSTLASAFAVSSTQTLGGAGTVTGPISVSGNLSPGVGAATLASTTGTLATGNATFAATGAYACTLNGASSDLLAAGTLTVDPAAKITFSGTPTAGPYVIATYTGAAPTHFATDGTLPSGYHLDYTEAGKIKLVQDAGGGTPFENWAAGPPYNLTGSDALPGADPDNDGVKNVAEFALGGNPKDGSKNGTSLAKVQDVSGSPALTLTFLTRIGTSFDTGSGPRTATKDGVTYSVQGGQNLSSWTATITEVPVITPGAPSGYEYHTFKTAGPVSSTARDFIRVQVVGQ